jgi:flagellin-like hook-associated protein FlgL
MVSLLSNIAALKSQTKLNQVTRNVTSSFEKLASGLRINKASDDAAGLAISSELNLDKRVYHQGVRNINDGISLLTIADSAVNELSDILSRMQELAQQGANGSYSNNQREALQKEATALTSEYNRILNTTRFNDMSILTGSGTSLTLQGGFGTNGTLSSQIGASATAGDQAGITRLVSYANSGAQANNNVTLLGISADGRYLGATSLATNLVNGDANSQQDSFRIDAVTGEIKLASTTSSGVQGNGLSTTNTISADGRYVGFISLATNLAAGDTNGVYDAFVKDMETGELKLVSSNSSGIIGNLSSFIREISIDNRFALIHSAATNLVVGDTNGVYDVFLKNLLTNETTLVSTSSTNQQANGDSFSGGVSGDGRYVLFRSDATNLVAGDVNGVTDVFVKDIQTGTVRLVSTSSLGVQGNGSSSAIAITHDGVFAAFNSNASNLVSDDTNGVQDSFVKNLITGDIINVNTDSNGQIGNGASGLTGLSADGRFVTFRSLASNLVAGDTNGVQDVFVKDLLTNETRIVSVATDGTIGNGSSSISSISGDGRFVAFESASTNLAGTDSNGFTDIFIRDLKKVGVQEISGIVVSNQGSARLSLALIERNQQELSSYRVSLGTSLSRADTFVRSLKSLSEQTENAVLRITDVDVAEESSHMIKNQILQQAGTSVMAQANLQPKVALRLLELL